MKKKVAAMAYSADVDNGVYIHEVAFVHTPTGLQMHCQLLMQPANGQTPTEAQRDSVFQAFVTKVSELNNITITYSRKISQYTSTVT